MCAKVTQENEKSPDNQLIRGGFCAPEWSNIEPIFDRFGDNVRLYKT
jgi:hypothetical protein